ncbi:hypothetical protein MBLNU457_3988t1 [Dothideomycetes sp. NU457]
MARPDFTMPLVPEERYRMDQRSTIGADQAQPSIKEAADGNCERSRTAASSHDTARSTKDPRRTLRFTNLPNYGPLIAFAAMCDVIRGGRITEFSAVTEDGLVCNATMADGAGEFLNHVRRHGLRIAGKDVIVDWAPRDLEISDYSIRAIQRGKTRNVVIVGARGRRHPELIRIHLSGIGLIVLSITQTGRDVIIETPSMQMAGMCRSALLHDCYRAAYRDFDIAYAPDGCAEPLT